VAAYSPVGGVADAPVTVPASPKVPLVK